MLICLIIFCLSTPSINQFSYNLLSLNYITPLAPHPSSPFDLHFCNTSVIYTSVIPVYYSTTGLLRWTLFKVSLHVFIPGGNVNARQGRGFEGVGRVEGSRDHFCQGQRNPRLLTERHVKIGGLVGPRHQRQTGGLSDRLISPGVGRQ